jgi:hypothetical protein
MEVWQKPYGETSSSCSNVMLTPERWRLKEGGIGFDDFEKYLSLVFLMADKLKGWTMGPFMER